VDRLDCLRAFVRTMEGGSFSAAARELGIGQPAVSKRIAMLESEFGSQLFLRTTRKFRPTAEALRIYQVACDMLASYDLARASVRETAPRPTGTLRLSIPTSFGRHYLTPILAEYLQDNPDVRVDVQFSERFVNLIEEGVELALRIGALQSSSLIARRLGTVRLNLVASPAYLRGRPLPRTPDDLRSHQCIVYSRFSAANQWTFESEHGRHVVTITGRIQVDDADAMQDAVLHHLGIAVLPDWKAVDLIRSGQLEALLPEYSLATLPLNAVYPATQWMSARARAFLDLLTKRSDRLQQKPESSAQR